MGSVKDKKSLCRVTKNSIINGLRCYILVVQPFRVGIHGISYERAMHKYFIPCHATYVRCMMAIGRFSAF